MLAMLQASRVDPRLEPRRAGRRTWGFSSKRHPYRSISELMCLSGHVHDAVFVRMRLWLDFTLSEQGKLLIISCIEVLRKLSLTAA